MKQRAIVCYLLLSAFCLSNIAAHELCADLTGAKDVTMGFCTDYNHKSCCSTQKEQSIQTQYNSLAISNAQCSAFVQKILCSACDPWGAHLFDTEASTARAAPFMCTNYCNSFYTTCKDVNLNFPGDSSPFGTNVLSQKYANADVFCEAHQAANDWNACYNGTKFEPRAPPPLNTTGSPICLEKIAESSWTDQLMTVVSPHDGSDNLVALYKTGKVLLLKNDGTTISTFLTIPNVLNDGEAGALSIVFHPNYTSNGRFFVSYSCNNCPAPCTVDFDCGGNNGKCVNQVCTGGDHTLVVDEYTVDSADKTKANPTSVQRLFATRKPWRNHNGGMLLFGPFDHYLYLTVGDGGLANDPNNNSQNLKAKLGKIHRWDVGNAVGTKPVAPASNPFVGQDGALPEIYAYGLRNPWRCSFDRSRAGYLYCGDVGQDAWEEVDVITKGGNFGWRDWEGTHVNTAPANHQELPARIQPVIEYSHGTVGGGPSVIGGYVVRDNGESCLTGKYLYADWEGIYFVADPNSWSTSRIGLKCATGSRLPCNVAQMNLFSFNEDDQARIYLATSTGLYRAVSPDRCGSPACPIVTQGTTSTYESSSVATGTGSGSSSSDDGNNSNTDATGSSSSSDVDTNNTNTDASDTLVNTNENSTSDNTNNNSATDNAQTDPSIPEEEGSAVSAVSSALLIISAIAIQALFN